MRVGHQRLPVLSLLLLLLLLILQPVRNGLVLLLWRWRGCLLLLLVPRVLVVLLLWSLTPLLPRPL